MQRRVRATFFCNKPNLTYSSIVEEIFLQIIVVTFKKQLKQNKLHTKILNDLHSYIYFLFLKFILDLMDTPTKYYNHYTRYY